MHSILLPLVVSIVTQTQAPSQIQALTPDEKAAMLDVTWRPGCPVSLEELRRVQIPYNALDGQSLTGDLIVHQDVATEVMTIFTDLHKLGFVIEKISPALTQHGKDDALMRSNITSAFNCRRITGGKGFSRHSYGKAIDINPLWNPYIKGKKVLPKEAPTFARPPRDVTRPGLIHRDSAVIKVFRKYGWHWGGYWKRVKDFQHFEKKSR